MNPDLERQLAAADAVMKETGETQPIPPGADGRAVTSPANGAQGGRRAIDYGKLAEEYKMQRGAAVRWYKGEFFEYDRERGAYRRITEREEGAMVGAFLKSDAAPLFYSANAERNVVGALRATANIFLAPPCFLDTGASAAGWAAMKNGLLDLEAAAAGRVDCLHPHSSNFFSTRFFPFAWDLSARCPRFMRFLEEAQPDEEGRDMVKKLAGLLLVPETCFNVFFVLLGEGGCGKSTLLKIVGAMLGEDNVCAVPLSMFAEKHTTHRLTRCLANLVEDSPTADGRGTSLHGIEGILKQVTDGGLLHVEPKGIDPWEAPATARCVFCQNPPLPPFADRSEAIWDRLRVIPFPTRFRGTGGQNPRLAAEIIAEELPGVFRWALEGLGELRKMKQFPQSAAGAAIIREHRETCDRERVFLSARYVVSNGAFTPTSIIYPAYRAWCDAEGYPHPKNSANFSQEVRRVFPQVESVNIRVGGIRARGFRNLAALADDD